VILWRSQDIKTSVRAHSACAVLFKLLAAAEKIGYYGTRGCLRQARDLASGDLRHSLCINHADPGTRRRFSAKNNHCYIALITYALLAFAFYFFQYYPALWIRFSSRFRCSRTTLHQALLGRRFCAAGSVKQSFREMCSGCRKPPPGSSRLNWNLKDHAYGKVQSAMSFMKKILEGATLLPFVKLPFAGRPVSPDDQVRHDLVEFGRMLHTQGFVAATDGNLSVRLDSDRVMVTPTAVSKGMMRPEEMVVVDMDGNRVSGCCSPTSEIAMHLTIYSMRPDVGAVVHAHPARRLRLLPLDWRWTQPLCSEVVVTLGEVPLAPYATTGTVELSDSLRPFIPEHNAILMAKPRSVTYGHDLRKAYLRMEAVGTLRQDRPCSPPARLRPIAG